MMLTSNGLSFINTPVVPSAARGRGCLDFVHKPDHRVNQLVYLLLVVVVEVGRPQTHLAPCAALWPRSGTHPGPGSKASSHGPRSSRVREKWPRVPSPMPSRPSSVSSRRTSPALPAIAHQIRLNV